MGVHENHRVRVKNRFKQYGLDAFEEHQALELLLFYCVPRRDTNVIAHRLIERFHSFSQVLDAPIKELEKVEGVGHSVALYLKLLRDTFRYYQNNHNNQEDVILNDLKSCQKHMVACFDGLNVEAVYMLGLDAKCKVLCCREIGRGSVNATQISVRKIVDMALTENVTSVVLAHNHPSGLGIPSYEDIETTYQIAKALHAIDVILLDHIIVCESDYVSMADSNIFKPDY